MTLNGIPTSGLRGCHSLGGRARWQPFTHHCIGILAFVAWRMTLSLYEQRQGTPPQCGNGGISNRHGSELGCQLGQAIPAKP